MTTRNISIPHEIDQLLKKEVNASHLITRLLFDYYKYKHESVDDIDNRLKELEEQKRINNDSITLEEQKLKVMKTKKIEKETEQLEDMKIQQEKKEKVIQNTILNAKAVFNIDLKYELAKEFIESSEFENITQFLKYKNLIDENEY